MMAIRTFRSHFFKLYFHQIHIETSPQIKDPKNPIIYNYLIDTLNFPKVKALKCSERSGRLKTLENPQSVIALLKSFNLSDSQVQSAVYVCPQIIFSDVDKILRPKLKFFHDLGFPDSSFGKFIAKNSSVLTYSLEDTLKPSTEILKKMIGYDVNNKNLVRVFRRCSWCFDRSVNARMVSNALYLKSCGIDDKNVSKLFTLHPKLFAATESELKAVIEKVLGLGFGMDSKMLIYIIYTIGTFSSETIERKINSIISFGFSRDECWEMFRRCPYLFSASEEKLRFALGFLLDTVKLEKLRILHRPVCLLHSVEDRLIARYRVMKTLSDKGLLKKNKNKKEPAFDTILHVSEKDFLQNYILKFENYAEELLYVYKGHNLESSPAVVEKHV